MDVALLALVQACYYLPTGVWPLIHVRSFLWATGPKTDLWLLQTVGVLIAAIGAALLVAGWRDAVGADTAVLAVAAAAGLAAIDVVFVSRGVISRIYVLDAVLEGLLVSCWIAAVAA